MFLVNVRIVVGVALTDTGTPAPCDIESRMVNPSVERRERFIFSTCLVDFLNREDSGGIDKTDNIQSSTTILEYIRGKVIIFDSVDYLRTIHRVKETCYRRTSLFSNQSISTTCLKDTDETDSKCTDSPKNIQGDKIFSCLSYCQSSVVGYIVMKVSVVIRFTIKSKE